MLLPRIHIKPFTLASDALRVKPLVCPLHVRHLKEQTIEVDLNGHEKGL